MGQRPNTGRQAQTMIMIDRSNLIPNSSHGITFWIDDNCSRIIKYNAIKQH